MLHGKKIAVAMPAYNAEKTLVRTYREIPKNHVDDIILIDDASKDGTIEVAKTLDLHLVVNEKNLGFGGNHKACFAQALKRGADVVVILHPDYQYPADRVLAMAEPIAKGDCDVVYGSRFLEGSVFDEGMPFLTYLANRLSTHVQGFITRHRMSEYHTGYCAFSREVLLSLPLMEIGDDFIFNNQILIQLFHFGYRIGEVPATCAYHEDSSSIGISRTIKFSFGVVKNVTQFLLEKANLAHFPMFSKSGRKLNVS